MTHAQLFQITRHVVHVWSVALDIFEARTIGASQLLSPDERARASRFHLEADRRRFITGRRVLRQMLGRYLHIPPEQVRFEYGGSGKPELAPDLNPNHIRFSVSHSDAIALYAFTVDRAVGIDIEQVRTLPDAAIIAARFFSEGEQSRLCALASDQHQAAFFRGWTCKEAYLKAIGAGLTELMSQVEVSLDPAAPAQLLSTGGDPREATRWKLLVLEPSKGYVGALAAEGHDWQLVERAWSSNLAI